MEYPDYDYQADDMDLWLPKFIKAAAANSDLAQLLNGLILQELRRVVGGLDDVYGNITNLSSDISNLSDTVRNS